MFNRIAQLLATSVLLFMSASAIAKGPSISVYLETIGSLPVTSVSIKGPRKSCDASKTNVTIERDLDDFSPSIIEAVANGKVIPSMVVQIGGGEFWFENVLITSYSASGSGNSTPIEDFSIEPESVSPQRPPDCG